MEQTNKTKINEVVLEHSRNPHKLKSDQGFVILNNYKDGSMLIDCKEAQVLHGEHRNFVVKGKILKVTQMEYNPVLEATQKAFD